MGTARALDLVAVHSARVPMSMLRRPLYIAAIPFLATSLAWAAPAAPAPLFHARLESSVPAADDTLTAPLDTLRLDFSARVGLDFTRLMLLLPAGDSLALAPAARGEEGRVIVAAMPALGAGDHVLRWRTTSADGHVLSGTIPFHVAPSAARAGPRPDTSATTAAIGDGDGDRAAPRSAASARADQAGAMLPLLRATGTALLLMLAGALVFAARAPAGFAAMRPVLTALALAAPAAALAELVVWTGRVTGGMELGLALQLATGRALLARTALAAAAAAVLVTVRSARAAALLAFAALLAGGWLGHASAVSPALSIPLRTAHLGAAAVWLGGVVALVLALRAPDGPTLPLVRAVSTAALWSFVVVALTGVAQALVLVGGPDALFTSAYGRVALVKATGLLALAAFGRHHRRLIARMERGSDGAPLRASATRELLLFVGLIVVSAALSFMPLPE